MDTATPVLPDPQTAVNYLNGNIYARVLFQKLAAAGHVPQNEYQAEQFITLAGNLRVLADDSRVKAAAAANDPISQANKDAEGLLVRYGIRKSAAANEEAIAVRQMAIRLASDPGTYNSVMSLKAAEAQAIASQMNEKGN